MKGGVAAQSRLFQAGVSMKKIRIESPEVSPVREREQPAGKRPFGKGFLGLLILTYLVSMACLFWIFYIRSKF